jgi:hypothetical protein
MRIGMFRKLLLGIICAMLFLLLFGAARAYDVEDSTVCQKPNGYFCTTVKIPGYSTETATVDITYKKHVVDANFAMVENEGVKLMGTLVMSDPEAGIFEKGELIGTVTWDEGTKKVTWDLTIFPYGTSLSVGGISYSVVDGSGQSPAYLGYVSSVILIVAAAILVGFNAKLSRNGKNHTRKHCA